MDVNDKKIIKNCKPSQASFKNSPILMSLMFYNTRISQKLRLMVESAVQDVIIKYFDDQDKGNDVVRVFEQNSAIKLNEDGLDSVVSCSHIYENMMIDRVGMSLYNNDPSKTHWYGAPHYDQLYLSCKTNSNPNNKNINGEQLSLEPRIEKSCFNCDSIEHEISKCPNPKDFARINAKKKEFLGTLGHSTMNPNDLRYRYHDEPQTKNPYHGCEPGKLSDELRRALNLKKNQLPLYVYRMRVCGYPPGYNIDHSHRPNIDLIEHPNETAMEASFSIVEDCIDESVDAAIEAPAEILYPGFNAPMPDGVYDEGPRLGFPKLRRRYSKKTSSNKHTAATDEIANETISNDNDENDEVIFVGSNFENVVNNNNSIQIQRCRSWYVEPLSTGMFIPKPTWRRPPLLESCDNYKEPEVVLEDLKANRLIPCDTSCLAFGDQCIPTERLKRIQAILNKMHTSSNAPKKSKKRKSMQKS